MMKINKLYPVKTLFAVFFFVAFASACWPDIRFYPDRIRAESFMWRVGFFCGVFCFELRYSLHILICLYLVFYFLTFRFFLSAIFVKTALFTCFLACIFVTYHIDFPGTWFHPSFIASAVVGVVIFYLFTIYYIDWKSIDRDIADWESDYGRSISGEAGE